MPRTQRLIIHDETAVYHLMSRTALDGFPLGDIEKDFILDLIKRYSSLFFVEILGFCLMGNHFHILVRMFAEYKFTDEDIKNRYVEQYGDDMVFAEGLIPALRLKEFGVLDAEERLKRYRRYVYEAGAVNRTEKLVAPVPSSGATGQAGIIDKSVLGKERKNDFEIKRVQRFRYRTRYFTDSGIIGTKEFVSSNYHKFKDVFMSKREKVPRPVAGLDGVFSLKRLAE